MTSRLQPPVPRSATVALVVGIASAVPWMLLQYRPVPGMPHRYATFIEVHPLAGALDVAVFLLALTGGTLSVLLGWRAMRRTGAPSPAAVVGITLGVVSLVAYALPALPQVVDVLTGIGFG